MAGVWEDLTPRDRELIVIALRLAPTVDVSDGSPLDAAELDALADRLDHPDPLVESLQDLVEHVSTMAAKQRDDALVTTVESLYGMCKGLAGSLGGMVAVINTLQEHDRMPEGYDATGLLDSARNVLYGWAEADGPIDSLIKELKK